MEWQYRPQLDGLRAVAVYLVVAFHADLAWASGGFIGVDLFFVLSGFLVTMIILQEVDQTGSFSLRRFYARRVRRLLPAAIVAIAAICFVQLLVAALPARLGMVADARAALLYFANWQFIADARDYFGSGRDTSPFLHFWSLSIEEQFYVVYPLLLLLILVKGRQRESRLAVVLGLLLVASLALQVRAASVDVDYAYYATHTRIYQLLAGGLLALAVRRFASASTGRPRLGGGIAIGGLSTLLLLASDVVPLDQSTRGIACTLAAVAAIGGMMAADQAPISRLLARPLPRYLGQISYSTYLWHWPVILLVNHLFAVGPWVDVVLAGTIATAMAALSHQVLETPIRRSPRLDGFSWPVVAAGLTASVVVASVVVPTVLESARRPAVKAPQAYVSRPHVDVPQSAGLEAPVPTDIDYESLLEDDGETGPQCADGTPESCEVVADNDGPLVVLVGDSHAAMLAPAFHRLAEEHQFRLSTDIMNKCPWFDGLTVNDARQDVREACAAMRTDFYERILPEMDADVVVLVSRVLLDDRWASQVTAADAADHPGETHQQMLARLAQRTVGGVRATGARVVIVHTIFGTGGYTARGFHPLDCLSTAERISNCLVVPPTERPSVDALYTKMDRQDPGVSTVDLKQAYCPLQKVCAPIVDGVVTWKDINHISSDFVVAIRDRIWQAVSATPAWSGDGVVR